MLRTERLILRRWRDADLVPFAALNADALVMEHFPWRLDRAESDAMAERIRDHFTREGFGLWAAEVPGVAPFIGFVGLARPSFRPEDVEIGWRIASQYWGAGYATEGARAAVAHAFGPLGLDRLISMTVPRNVRSQRVMAKLGFVRDPDGDFEHPRIPEGNPTRSHWLFRLAAR